MNTLSKASGIGKKKAELALTFYMLLIVLAALILMSVEFFQTFFSYSLDSSISYGSKLLLALGWVLFPSMFHFLSKAIGNLMLLPSLNSERTPMPWKVARLLSKNQTQAIFRNVVVPPLGRQ